MFSILPGYAAALTSVPERALIVADIHFGFESELRAMGINIPSQTEKILSQLVDLIERNRVNTLYVLGDIKHRVPRISREEWRELPWVIETLRRRVRRVCLIPGNHDGGVFDIVPSSIERLPSRGIVLKGKRALGLLHGHTWPARSLIDANVLVMGHLHPVVELETTLGYSLTRRVWVKYMLDRRELGNRLGGESSGATTRGGRMHLLVMPSFNEFLSGVPINGERRKRLIGPVLRSGLVNHDRAEIYLLDGTYLGRIGQIKTGEIPGRRTSRRQLHFM